MFVAAHMTLYNRPMTQNKRGYPHNVFCSSYDCIIGPLLKIKGDIHIMFVAAHMTLYNRPITQNKRGYPHNV